MKPLLQLFKVVLMCKTFKEHPEKLWKSGKREHDESGSLCHYFLNIVTEAEGALVELESGNSRRDSRENKDGEAERKRGCT
ncbi:unnamed protein product [Tuber aestivum]|uniref:Uncharacterized protein n=1 Tax=Tuber aestivum TaxID=59557 RepID=A0A292Q3H8_9PEZI|nr:unnamed protein product [Tuber aestivum]